MATKEGRQEGRKRKAANEWMDEWRASGWVSERKKELPLMKRKSECQQRSEVAGRSHNSDALGFQRLDNTVESSAPNTAMLLLAKSLE